MPSFVQVGLRTNQNVYYKRGCRAWGFTQTYLLRSECSERSSSSKSDVKRNGDETADQNALHYGSASLSADHDTLHCGSASLSEDHNVLRCGNASLAADHNALRCVPRFQGTITTCAV